MSNYPPGVTGNELPIAGPDFADVWLEACRECGGDVEYWGYDNRTYLTCHNCAYQIEVATEPIKEDPEDAIARRRGY